MRKIIFAALLTLSVVTVEAKSTYIPTYTGYIHIKDGTDTMSVSNNLLTLDLTDKSGAFRVSVVHEDVSRERIKAIKRNKAAAGWMQVSAIASAVSSVGNAINGNFGVASLGLSSASMASTVSGLYRRNASAAEVLGMEVWIDNLKDEELLVADIDRGFVWYVQPRQTIQITVQNPDVTHLRVSDIYNRHIQMVTTAGGSSLRKELINYEDDNCWIVEVWQGEDYAMRIAYYQYIDKKTFESKAVFPEAIEDFKKQLRKQ